MPKDKTTEIPIYRNCPKCGHDSLSGGLQYPVPVTRTTRKDEDPREDWHNPETLAYVECDNRNCLWVDVGDDDLYALVENYDGEQIDVEYKGPPGISISFTGSATVQDDPLGNTEKAEK